MTDRFYSEAAAWRMPDDAWLLAEGPDYLDLLNRLSTGSVADLDVGQGAETVITSGKGRIVARLFVGCAEPEQVWSYGDAGSTGAVEAHLARYTFAEKTGLSRPNIVAYGFSRAMTDTLSTAFGIAPPPPLGVVAVGEGRLWFGHDGFTSAGTCLLLTDSESRFETLLLDETELESRRIRAGLPRFGHELTEKFNPLEAGLIDAVDFKKGCYVGQEVVARLFNYDKVSRSLLRWTRSGAAPETGSVLTTADGKTAGVITSVDPLAEGDLIHGLAYIKNSVATPGDRVVVKDDSKAGELTLSGS
jgi:folate-binding protein YgfZ